MKKALCYALLLTTGLACATDISVAERMRRGTYNAVAKQKVILRCVDKDGHPLSDVMVWSGVSLNGNPDTFTPISGKTDQDGCFVVEGKSYGEVGYVCAKEGFYETRAIKWLPQNPAVTVSNGCWQPYGMTNTVVLKRKVNPVAMYVRPNREGLTPLVPPVKNEYIGFDLEKGDWVKPYGKGICPDFNLRYEYEAGTVPLLHYRGAVFFAFTNKYDGAYVMKKDAFSSFKSVYQADTNDFYHQEFAFVYDRLSAGSIKEDSRLSGTDFLILRTRSKTDKDGNLISAHYSKLYGPVAAGKGGVYMGYYFNPNENDPSLEADTTRNLLNSGDLGFAP